jgi:hypothetical protein
MRKVLLAALLLGIVLALPGPAGAGGVLGRARVGSFGPPVAVYPYAYPYYPAPVYAPPYYYGYGPSYFRPEAPLAWNAQRNWRDTWQDDGVKVHAYTLGNPTR